MEEALAWLNRNEPVHILSEAIPWPQEMPASNLPAQYKRERSFAATSGNMPIRVLVSLAAPITPRCPNLGSDGLCKIYASRPLVCRIYPAEINPFIPFNTAWKQCPPEAWANENAPFICNEEYASTELQTLIRTVQKRTVNDVPILRLLCKELDVRHASLSNEGYIATKPKPAELKAAITRSQTSSEGTCGANWTNETNWIFISNQQAMVDDIRACHALSEHTDAITTANLEYLPR